MSWPGSANRQRSRPEIPKALIDLLNASALVFDAAGDHPTAEEQQVRVAKLAYELDDHDRIVTSLTTLIELYRRWDRPSLRRTRRRSWQMYSVPAAMR